jgi:glycine cleavage system aminomethyltransferase T
VMDGEKLGEMTACAWSYRMQTNIGFALISTRAKSGDRVEILRTGGAISARLVDLPFL